MMKQMRGERGNAITLSVVLALVIVTVSIGFILLSMQMGGQSEVKNAVDAGALNLGKQVVDNVNVTLEPKESQLIFADVTNDSINPNTTPDLNINLHRVNRMWGEAMLMAINAQSATAAEKGDMVGHADEAHESAEKISDALTDKLTKPSNLYDFFTDFTRQNNVRMLGKELSVDEVEDRNWSTSLMERQESNLVLSGGPNDGFFLPGSLLNVDDATKCTRRNVPTEAQDFFFLRGYKPIEIGGKSYYQVPFHYGEKPHLVSRAAFDKCTQSVNPVDWDKPLPNAFSAEGVAQRTDKQSQTAVSWVLTNPNQSFHIAIPHSFMKIHLDPMLAHWYFLPFGVKPVEFPKPATQEYGYKTNSYTGTTMPAGGPFCATVSPQTILFGLEVLAKPLDTVIFGMPTADTDELEKDMVTRINQMVSKPGRSFNANDLHSLLQSPATIAWMIAGERDFYVYSPDGDTLTVQPKYLAVAQARWLGLPGPNGTPLIENSADGNERKMVDDADMPAAVNPAPPTVVPDFACVFVFASTLGTNDMDLYWKPGSGYKGNLGEVRVKRWTDVYSIGVCAPVI